MCFKVKFIFYICVLKFTKKNMVGKGHFQLSFSLSGSVIRSQETWHNSHSDYDFTVRPATNHSSSSWCWMHNWDIQNGLRECLFFSVIWTRHVRRREQSLYQLGHITLLIFLWYEYKYLLRDNRASFAMRPSNPEVMIFFLQEFQNRIIL